MSTKAWLVVLGAVGVLVAVVAWKFGAQAAAATLAIPATAAVAKGRKRRSATAKRLAEEATLEDEDVVRQARRAREEAVARPESPDVEPLRSEVIPDAASLDAEESPDVEPLGSSVLP